MRQRTDISVITSLWLYLTRELQNAGQANTIFQIAAKKMCFKIGLGKWNNGGTPKPDVLGSIPGLVKLFDVMANIPLKTTCPTFFIE